MKIRIIIILVSCGIIILFGVYQYFLYSQNKMIIVFCNVGQGDGVYIRTPRGTDMLIDSGPDVSILSCLGRHMPFWDKSIELVFATHPDADHIGGFKYVFESYHIKSYNTVLANKDTGFFKLVSQKLDRKDIPIQHLTAGSTYTLEDGISLETKWPTADFLKVGDADSNRYSLIQLLNFYNFNILLSGDADFDIVEGVLGSIKKDNVSIEIFKLPHHGSKTGIGPDTFSLIKPNLSIISAGRDNRYGHPHRQVIDEMKEYGVNYLETKNGDIKIVTDGKSFEIRQ